MQFKLGMTVDLCIAYAYACFDDLDLDTWSQWVGKDNNSVLNYLHNYWTKQAISTKLAATVSHCLCDLTCKWLAHLVSFFSVHTDVCHFSKVQYHMHFIRRPSQNLCFFSNKVYSSFVSLQVIPFVRRLSHKRFFFPSSPIYSGFLLVQVIPFTFCLNQTENDTMTNFM